MTAVWVLGGILAVIALLCACGMICMWADGTDVPPWRKFWAACPVCRKSNVYRKAHAENDVIRGFGTKRHEGPRCDRCGADLAEPYRSNPYVAALVAEAQRTDRFKAEAEAYNAAIEAARKGAA